MPRYGKHHKTTRLTIPPQVVSDRPYRLPRPGRNNRPSIIFHASIYNNRRPSSVSSRRRYRQNTALGETHPSFPPGRFARMFLYTDSDTESPGSRLWGNVNTCRVKTINHPARPRYGNFPTTIKLLHTNFLRRIFFGRFPPAYRHSLCGTPLETINRWLG